MKNTIILLFNFITLYSFGQVTPQVTEGPCEEYTVMINESTLDNSSSCEYDITSSYSPTSSNIISLTDRTSFSALNGVSTLDFVLMTRVITDTYTEDNAVSINEAIYNSDVDQDGAVSTYDLTLLKGLILGVTDELPSSSYHLIESSQIIPELDPFDIQVDYSVLEIEGNSNLQDINVKVLKLGDLNRNSR